MEANGRVQRGAGAFVCSGWTGKSRRMDSMEVNKGIAAILVAGILFFLTGLIGDSLVRERLPEKPVLNIATAPTAPTGGGEAKPAGPAPIAPLLASADAKSGDQPVGVIAWQGSDVTVWPAEVTRPKHSVRPACLRAPPARPAASPPQRAAAADCPTDCADRR